jgi:hypothetical protein
MDTNRLIHAFGGTSAVARLFNIRPPSVSGWRKKGIPDARLMYLRLLRPELFDGKDVQMTGFTSRLTRAPNGAARPRIQVALPEDVLKDFLLDARNNMRSLSAQAALIIREHYVKQEARP